MSFGGMMVRQGKTPRADRKSQRSVTKSLPVFIRSDKAEQRFS